MSHSDNGISPKGDIGHDLPVFNEKELKSMKTSKRLTADAYRPESMVIDYDDINL